MKYKVLEFERRGAIALLTLNRPDRMNALTLELLGEMQDVLGKLMGDIKTRVLIIQGKGRAFCSGLDLNLFKAVMSEEHELGKVQYVYRELQQVFSSTILGIRRIPQPVITAVGGPATGAGFSLALTGDVCIAGESARFNAAFMKVGFSGCDCGSSYFLPRMIGRSRANEYLLTGRFMDAVTAERFGLVSRIVPDAKVEAAAMELAEEMLLTSPLGLRMTKEVLNQNIDAPSLESAVQLEDRTQTLCILTEDGMEGPKAFLEKRTPKWRDR